MGKRWLQVCVSILIYLGGQAQIVHSVQSGTPDHPIAWEPLPNGLISMAYDGTGDGIPDHFTLHPITWSGWSAQAIKEIEHQACMDDQWVFMVEYAQDRYVYFAQQTPVLVGDDPKQTGRWMAQNVRPTDVKEFQHLNQTAHQPNNVTCPIAVPRQHQKP
ncbi:hypothetical protein PJI16_08845 [Nitrospira sp. MA-1]|nr:hypothetical protein [Nitrospira sp. MA-1]